tara:strand:- start:175 stop:510 length:336 start_codon:yes stop_codon:yes gene_type:complete
MSAVVTTVAKDSLFFDYNDLENLKQETDDTVLRGDVNEFAKQINALKIKNQILQSQLKIINDEKYKNDAEAIQPGYHIQEMTVKVTELENKLKNYESVTQEMMKLGGYGLN